MSYTSDYFTSLDCHCLDTKYDFHEANRQRSQSLFINGVDSYEAETKKNRSCTADWGFDNFFVGEHDDKIWEPEINDVKYFGSDRNNMIFDETNNKSQIETFNDLKDSNYEDSFVHESLFTQEVILKLKTELLELKATLAVRDQTILELTEQNKTYKIELFEQSDGIFHRTNVGRRADWCTASSTPKSATSLHPDQEADKLGSSWLSFPEKTVSLDEVTPTNFLSSTNDSCEDAAVVWKDDLTELNFSSSRKAYSAWDEMNASDLAKQFLQFPEANESEEASMALFEKHFFPATSSNQDFLIPLEGEDGGAAETSSLNKDSFFISPLPAARHHIEWRVGNFSKLAEHLRTPNFVISPHFDLNHDLLNSVRFGISFQTLEEDEDGDSQQQLIISFSVQPLSCKVRYALGSFARRGLTTTHDFLKDQWAPIESFGAVEETGKTLKVRWENAPSHGQEVACVVALDIFEIQSANSS